MMKRYREEILPLGLIVAAICAVVTLFHGCAKGQESKPFDPGQVIGGTVTIFTDHAPRPLPEEQLTGFQAPPHPANPTTLALANKIYKQYIASDAGECVRGLSLQDRQTIPQVCTPEPFTFLGAQSRFSFAHQFQQTLPDHPNYEDVIIWNVTTPQGCYIVGDVEEYDDTDANASNLRGVVVQRAHPGPC